MWGGGRTRNIYTERTENSVDRRSSKVLRINNDSAKALLVYMRGICVAWLGLRLAIYWPPQSSEVENGNLNCVQYIPLTVWFSVLSEQTRRGILWGGGRTRNKYTERTDNSVDRRSSKVLRINNDSAKALLVFWGVYLWLGSACASQYTDRLKVLR